MTTTPVLTASGTALVIVRARAKSEVNGVFVPDSAQKASCWGRILSRGHLVDRVRPETRVVFFNPAMTMPGLEDSRGRVVFDVIDQEAVVAEANDEFASEANLVFDMPDTKALIAALGASAGVLNGAS